MRPAKKTAWLLWAIIVLIAVLAYLSGCSDMTADQINATTNAITSVVTTTGQVVTPLVVNYDNGKSVRVKRPKPTPTPKPSG